MGKDRSIRPAFENNSNGNGNGAGTPDTTLFFTTESKEAAQALSGSGRANLDVLCKELGVQIFLMGKKFQVKGDAVKADKALNVLKSLAAALQPETPVTPDSVRAVLFNPANQNAESKRSHIIVPQLGRIEPRNDRQVEQILGFRNSDAVIATGEAGTGKTWLSVMLAVEGLESGKFKNLVLVRPAVEAGEKLGFMPGSLQEKVDGYMRPLYDALHEVYGEKAVQSKINEQRIIEVAALAFMRGRNIKNSVVILDECQNTTVKQMKMMMTRVGEGSKIILAGDVTQIDIPDGEVSGLADYVARLKHPAARGLTEGTALVEYQPGDSVRSAATRRALALYAIDLKNPSAGQSPAPPVKGPSP